MFATTFTVAASLALASPAASADRPACHSPADWSAMPTGAITLGPGERAPMPTRPSDVDAYRSGRARSRCSLPNGSVRWRRCELQNTTRHTVVTFYWLETD